MRNVSGQNGKAPRSCPKGRQFLMVHAGLWERLGRFAQKVSKKRWHLPSGLCGTAKDPWKITLSLLCDWEVSESHELSVHVISDFRSKVHGRGWIVIFLLISLWRYWGYTDLIKVWSSPSSLFSGKGCVRLVLFFPWMFVKLFGPKVFFGQCVLNT